MENFIHAYSWINIRFLLQGLWVTIYVSLISIALSFVLGLVFGFIRYVKIKYLSAIVGFVIDIIRNLPLLLIIFFTYFGLPELGIITNPTVASIIALVVFEGAMLAEIVRSGIAAVDPGQMEGARSNGMTFGQAMYHVVVPQALHNMIPALLSQFVSLVKDTSLARIIAVYEIIFMGQSFITSKGLIWPLFYTAVFYLVFCGILTLVFRFAEKKMSYFHT